MVARSAELLQAELDRFESLLAELLEISRFDAGFAALDAEPANLGPLVERAVDRLRSVAERAGVEVEVDLPAEPVVAEVDVRRVERILRNLIGNAIEHGEGKPVLVRLAAREGAVAITVRDHGVGLKPGDEKLVFNRFWRADPSRARQTGGTGLGLSISVEDARLHGGWLEAWGAPGPGRTVPADRAGPGRRPAGLLAAAAGADRLPAADRGGARALVHQGREPGHRRGPAGLRAGAEPTGRTGTGRSASTSPPRCRPRPRRPPHASPAVPSPSVARGADVEPRAVTSNPRSSGAAARSARAARSDWPSRRRRGSTAGPPASSAADLPRQPGRDRPRPRSRLRSRRAETAMAELRRLAAAVAAVAGARRRPWPGAASPPPARSTSATGWSPASPRATSGNPRPPGPDEVGSPEELVTAYLSAGRGDRDRDQPIDRVKDVPHPHGAGRARIDAKNPPNPLVIRLLGDRCRSATKDDDAPTTRSSTR